MKKFLFSLSLLLFILLSVTACSTIFDTNFGTTTWISDELSGLYDIKITVTMELNSTEKTISLRSHSTQLKDPSTEEGVPDYVETGDYELLDNGNLSIKLYNAQHDKYRKINGEVIKSEKDTKIKLQSIYFNFCNTQSQILPHTKANVTFTKIK